MISFSDFIANKKWYTKTINEDTEKDYSDLPCYIDLTAETNPLDVEKLDNFLTAFYDFLDKWIADWKKKNPDM